MKSIRSLLLLIALGSVSLIPALAFGQQEVDPDHFDAPAAKSSIAKPHAHKAIAARHRSRAGHAKLASNHPSSQGSAMLAVGSPDRVELAQSR
jgi:hypothetical protein